MGVTLHNRFKEKGLIFRSYKDKERVSCLFQRIYISDIICYIHFIILVGKSVRKYDGNRIYNKMNVINIR